MNRVEQLVLWLWIGTGILALGAIVCLSHRDRAPREAKITEDARRVVA